MEEGRGEGSRHCLEVCRLLHVQSLSFCRQSSHDLRVDGVTFTPGKAYEKLAGVMMSGRDLSLAPTLLDLQSQPSAALTSGAAG